MNDYKELSEEANEKLENNYGFTNKLVVVFFILTVFALFLLFHIVHLSNDGIGMGSALCKSQYGNSSEFEGFNYNDGVLRCETKSPEAYDSIDGIKTTNKVIG